VAPYAGSMGVISDEGVLITRVYGAGKSTVAAEISYLLEQRRQPYALLDLDFLGWGVNSSTAARPGTPSCCATWWRWYRTTATGALASFPGLLRLQPRGATRYPGGGRGAAAGSPPVGAVARYRTAPGGRRDHRAAGGVAGSARQIAAGEGVGVEDVVLSNDRGVLDDFSSARRGPRSRSLLPSPWPVISATPPRPTRRR
jgi:hypothetical protein